MADDYYEVLKITRSATADEIQKAYRKLARKYHPDLHADKSERDRAQAQLRFKEIQTAYDVLNDPEKRQMYDRFGPNFESAGAPYGPSGTPPFGPGGQFENMEIDFSHIFGGPQGAGPEATPKNFGGFENLFRHFGGRGRGTAPGPNKGPDVEQEVTVSFHTAVKGGEHQVSLQRRGGKVNNIAVKIPAGIEDGKRIRLRGQGELGGPGSTRGDLLIKVRVAPHPAYTRQSLNLLVNVPITLKEAIFGTKIDLPTPKGTVTVTVPSGSESGKVLRLKGLGIKSKDQTGDLMVKLLVHVPKHISAADAKLLDGLSDDWNDPHIRSGVKW